MKRLLEIAADGVGSALAAQAGGADRIELCANLGEGGTTPSHGVIAVVREQLHIPLFVLIRPRGGDFLYDAFERDVMHRDVEQCKRLGCDGVVIGALTPSGDVDVATCRSLIDVAGDLQLTFHRAFDVAVHRTAALEDIIALGCHRVLTSGGQRSAEEGAQTIAQTVAQAAGRINVLAGAGIDAFNLAGLIERSRADEYHASARRMNVSAVEHRNEVLAGLDPDWLQTHPDSVQALRAVLDATQ